jgi:hypothetical protein
MTKNFQDELQCSQFEALLADVLDNVSHGEGDSSTLPASVRQAFDAHSRSCPLCGPLYAETRAGMMLLRSMQTVEPPKNLVHNILAATSLEGQETVVLGANDAPREKAGWLVSIRRSLSYAPMLMRSRFATSFVMAFFSLSVTLSLAGVRVGDIASIDWHPSALRKSVVLQYTQVESKVARYYDNMRLVYEVESRVQGLKKAVAPSGEGKKDDDDNNKQEQQNRNTPPDTSGQPQPHDTYSQERDSTPQLAQTGLARTSSGSLMAKSTTRNDEGASL